MKFQLLVYIFLLPSVACFCQELVTTESGLQYEVLLEGNGPRVKTGAIISIHESTSYRDGTLIFSSKQIGPPLTFKVGSKLVIQGVEEGVLGMQKGERRRLVVPPELSKRSHYPEILHPDSTLVYIIDLVNIKSTEN